MFKAFSRVPLRAAFARPLVRGMTTKDAHFIITATGPDRVGIVSELAKVIMENGGDIAESRMMRMGGDFTIMMRFAAPHNKLSSIESQLPSVRHMRCMTHGVSAKKYEITPHVVFKANFTLRGANEPGLVFKLADLFRQRKLRIETMASDTIDAPHGGTKLFLLNGVIESESPVDVSELNAAATDLANKMNMDVTINQIPS